MSERNRGIDLLRIVSMLMIIMYHIIVPGMGQYTFYNGTLSVKILYAIGSCGVNCFLLISGYVNLRSNYKLSRIIKLLLEAIFYNLLLTIIISISNGSLSFERIIESFDILSNENWWFIRAYLLLFIFMPIVNTAVNTMNKTETSITVILLIIFASIFTTIKGDVFYLGDGYSSLWFIIVYIIGAYIRKYEETLLNIKLLYFILFLLCIVITVSSFYFLFQYNGQHLHSYITEEKLFYYVSPTILLSSISLLMLFKNIKINQKLSKIIDIITPSIFPIYLIQCQHYIYKYYFPDYFSFLNKYNNKLLIFIPLIACLLMLTLLIIDQIRIVLRKILKIDKVYCYIDSKINLTK